MQSWARPTAVQHEYWNTGPGAGFGPLPRGPSVRTNAPSCWPSCMHSDFRSAQRAKLWSKIRERELLEDHDGVIYVLIRTSLDQGPRIVCRRVRTAVRHRRVG